MGKPAVVSGEIQNAILLLHGTTSTGAAFLAEGFSSAMFGSGQPLDASRYYLNFARFDRAWWFQQA